MRAPDADTIPKQIGPYRIRGKLGRGGMGVVYLAVDTELDREVAIKAVVSELAGQAGWLERLVREAKILARLNHPNIAQIYGLEERDEARYIILEYVPGKTLRDRLSKGAIELIDALRICGQVALALEVAHNRGIIHRDLKPDNIRITPEGIAKVLDFGIALLRQRGATAPTVRVVQRAVSASAATVRAGASSDALLGGAQASPAISTGEGLWGGTPAYMSPEQARSQPLDKRTDVFSFGAVMFECLTGRRAFDGPTDADKVAAVLLEEPDFDGLPHRTPVSIRELLPRCLEKDAGKRLRDLGEARQVIEEAVKSPERGEEPMVSIAAGPFSRTEDKPEIPHSLPGELTSFIGREELTERLRSLVQSTRLITLTGPGGCGKTRVASYIGADALPAHRHGVWFVELGPVKDREQVVPIVAAILAPDQFKGHVSAARLTEYLKSRSALLVFDGCEHVLETCRQLIDRLLRHCPKVRVLATSREPLGLGGELVFPVPALTVPGENEPPEPAELSQYESVRLFVERAALGNPRFALTRHNARAVAQVCRRLEGIPLAIELAASRARLLSAHQILEKLEQGGLRFLTGGGEAGEHHRTLRGSVERSYNLLKDEEQVMFRRLAVFERGFTLEAAVAVCGDGLDEYEVLHLLGRLVDKSVIVVDDNPEADPTANRYHLMESFREYAQSRLLSGERAAVCDAHVDFFLGLAERAASALSGRDDAEWVRRLDIERANLLGALRWSMASDDGRARDLRMAGILRKLSRELKALEWTARFEIRGAVLELVEGDIAEQQVDALVSATDSDYRGGDVAQAIHAAAGPQLAAECRALGRCPVGEARITMGYRLKARHVVHAVGPGYRASAGETTLDGGALRAQLLARAYEQSLKLASHYGLKSIAFPAISTGGKGYPLDEAAPIALRTVSAYMEGHPEIKLVRFVLLGGDARAAFERAAQQLLGPSRRAK